jgi:hypothetical protein
MLISIEGIIFVWSDKLMVVPYEVGILMSFEKGSLIIRKTKLIGQVSLICSMQIKLALSD